MFPEIEQFKKHLWRQSSNTSTYRHYTSDLQLFFTWAGKSSATITIGDVDAYITYCQEKGHAIATINRRLTALHSFYQFLTTEIDNPPPNPVLPRRHFIRQRYRLPRDVTDDTLDRLFAVISTPRDKAIFLLMLRCGLRTCEIRRLRLSDSNLGARQVRIEQSKGLQDRIVFLSQMGIEALKAYLAIRSPAETDYVFTYRRQPLKVGYCGRRLRLYGERCGLHITPHQLRFSCATLLLNAGTPILTVQRILGHQQVETTLRYARLYDSTIARDYGRAMAEVE